MSSCWIPVTNSRVRWSFVFGSTELPVGVTMPLTRRPPLGEILGVPLSSLGSTIPFEVGVRPARGTRRRGAEAARLVVPPRIRRRRRQRPQVVRQGDLRLVIERVAGVDRRLAVAEQIVRRGHARRPDEKDGIFETVPVASPVFGSSTADESEAGSHWLGSKSGRTMLAGTHPPRYLDVCQSYRRPPWRRNRPRL